MSYTDHRQSPRIEVADTVRVAFVPPLWPMHLADVSWGGFLVASPHPLPADTLLTFEFSDPNVTWTTQLQALAVHSHLRSLPDDRQVEHATGFEFVALDDPTVVDAIDRLLDVAMAAFGFDWTAVDVHGPL